MASIHIKGTVGGGYVTGDAPTRSELDACVECGLCLPHCPTFRLTGKEIASPRGRLAAMDAVLEGVAAVDDMFDEAISFCCGCRACEAVCPGLVPYGRLLEGARAELVVQRPTGGRRLRRFVLGRMLPDRRIVRAVTWLVWAVQRLGLTGLLPGFARRGITGMRPLEPAVRPWPGRSAQPAGEPIGTVALVSGCVMDAWFGPVHDATVSLLTRAGYRVVVPATQTCCGALVAHDGHAAEARRLAARNVIAFGDADLVVSDSAGCTAHLKEYDHWAENGASIGDKVRDVTELVAELIEAGRLPIVESDRGQVAMQDPCHLRHAQRVLEPPRAILRAAGYTPVEIDPDGLCCGAAGIYSVLRPEASAELGARKAAEIRGSGARIVASANPGCEMQLRSHLGGDVRVMHPIELYWQSLAERSSEYAPRPS